MKFLALIPALALAACSTTTANEPSLAPRAAEAIDPRLPVTAEPSNETVDPATASRIADLLASARTGAAAFDAAEPRVRALASRAGAAQSESWIAAQLGLSELGRHRAPGVAAASDLDELRAARIRAGQPLLASELELFEAAASELGQLNDRLAASYDSIASTLAS